MDIGIPEAQRAAIADSTVLYAKTHGFHWNVTGPMFNTLHLMFMEQYTELWTALDEIAERIRALGHVAPFGGSTYSGLFSIPETKGVPAAQPTADLLTQRLQIHEKTAWMLRSLLEN